MSNTVHTRKQSPLKNVSNSAFYVAVEQSSTIRQPNKNYYRSPNKGEKLSDIIDHNKQLLITPENSKSRELIDKTIISTPNPTSSSTPQTTTTSHSTPQSRTTPQTTSKSVLNKKRKLDSSDDDSNGPNASTYFKKKNNNYYCLISIIHISQR
ncbi:hypothetical protein ACTFIW_011080 [Dictyostelium discoideum]